MMLDVDPQDRETMAFMFTQHSLIYSNPRAAQRWTDYATALGGVDPTWMERFYAERAAQGQTLAASEQRIAELEAALGRVKHGE
jgi:hypothetical protein